MDSNNDVLFKEIPGREGGVGLITLNRPAVLNSLNHQMVLAMHKQLSAWQTASHIKAVIITAVEGRAFCAGGDLRRAYERFRQHDPALSLFFRDEYQLNRCIFHYTKPYIALLDGITMGGGAGISIHGSHRVATEKLLFAMPETGIGFFPDVGGTYFLPRLPYSMGFYLGLTGAKLAGDDCIALGIAQRKISPEKLPALIQAVADSPMHDEKNQAVTGIIQSFQVAPGPSTLMAHKEAIHACFSKTTIEDILSALHAHTNLLCKEAADAIAKKSPTSLKVTLRAMQEGRELDFDACMRQEYRLTCRFLQDHDFAEGIRAVIVDKDQRPKWAPPLLSQVLLDDIQQYFSPLTEELV